MARVKVSKIRVEDRLADVTNKLVSLTKSDNYAAGYPYACGYLESSLAQALSLLPPGKREQFLANLEYHVNLSVRKMNGEAA